jgi:hypothetical protein
MAAGFANMVKGKPAGTVGPDGSLTSAVRGLGRPADVDLVRSVVRIQAGFAIHGCDGHHVYVEKVESRRAKLLLTVGEASRKPLRLISDLQINLLLDGKMRGPVPAYNSRTFRRMPYFRAAGGVKGALQRAMP